MLCSFDNLANVNTIVLIICITLQPETLALTSGFRGCRRIVEATLIVDLTGLILTAE